MPDTTERLVATDSALDGIDDRSGIPAPSWEFRPADRESPGQVARLHPTSVGWARPAPRAL